MARTISRKHQRALRQERAAALGNPPDPLPSLFDLPPATWSRKSAAFCGSNLVVVHHVERVAHLHHVQPRQVSANAPPTQ